MVSIPGVLFSARRSPNPHREALVVESRAKGDEELEDTEVHERWRDIDTPAAIGRLVLFKGFIAHLTLTQKSWKWREGQKRTRNMRILKDIRGGGA